jgi:hypothetical protein
MPVVPGRSTRSLECMANKQSQAALPHFSDRLKACAIGAAGAVGTVTAAVLLIIFLTPRGGASRTVSGYVLEHVVAFGWSYIIIATAAAIAGFVLGTSRTMSLFGHVWFTERPANVALTSAIWGGMAIVLFVTLAAS